MCPGLGHIGRGYESFSGELFDALKGTERFDFQLYKGAGKTISKEHVLFCVKRKGKLSSAISKILGIEPYTLEQFTFSLSSIYYLLKEKPDVIVFSDFIFGVYLWYIRKFLRLKYKLLFSNGAPNGPPFTRCDHVQQLLPSLYQIGIDAGEPYSKFTLLPYGIHIPSNFEWPSEMTKEIWRNELGLPVNKKIVLSVGAVNKHHKRMDYLVKEFSHLDQNEFFLLVLGNFEEETKEITDLAESLLHPSSYSFRTVAYKEISRYYLAADLFVLCSLTEGFGRVYLEALLHGLPVIAHDYPVAREVMQEMGTYVNMEHQNALWPLLKNNPLGGHTKDQKRAFVSKTYSWDALLPAYISMIKTAASK